MGQKRDRIKKQAKSGNKPANYYAACWGKMRITKEQRKHLTIAPTAKIYKCKYCGYYHFGRKPWK